MKEPVVNYPFKQLRGNREKGDWLDTRFLSPDLNTGVTLDVFQSEGKIPVDRERLKTT